MAVCVLCGQTLESGGKTVVPTARGRDTINRASEERGDTIVVSEGQSVHEDCRRNYTNKYNIQSYLRKKQKDESETCITESLRSRNPNFDFANCCLFCGKEARFDARSGDDVHRAQTLKLKPSLSKVCLQRGDEWANTVKSRLELVADLPAADTVYHQTCSLLFRGKKRLSTCDSELEVKQRKLGRKVDENKAAAFQKITEFLRDNKKGQFPINDLINKMADLNEGNPYSHPKMKEELQKYFGEELYITNLEGKSNVVTLRKTASSILHNFCLKKTNDEVAQKKMIIETAAELIKNDIKLQAAPREQYPSQDDIASRTTNLDFVPDSLQLLLTTIFSKKDVAMKIASIGQAIMQAARPRKLICPLQIGLAVQMHHCFDSKFLIDTLYSLGFSSSYNEVLTFEMNAAVSKNSTECLSEGHFIQYMADNIDHNTATLDGLNTFHGMGIISSITPAVRNKLVVGRRTDIKAEDIIEKAKIDIRYYREEYNGLVKVKFSELKTTFVHDLTSEVDLLWKACWLLRPNRPSWSGVMQMVHQNSFPGQSSVMFLPMIDMNPSDKTCIYSTLHYVCGEAERNERTPVLTFDQPLWWKALSIISSEPDNSVLHSIVLRLGPFHLEMSFLACIGHLMEDTGLHEVLSTVYAPNAVNHMLHGKAVLRAVRGHFLVDAALNALLMSDTFHVPLPLPDTNVEESGSVQKGSSDEQHVGNASDLCSPENHEDSADQQAPNVHTCVADKACALVSQNDNGEHPDELQGHPDSTGLEGELVAVPVVKLSPDIKEDVTNALKEFEERKDLETVPSLFDQVLKGELDPLSVQENQHLRSICTKLREKKRSLTGKTAELWLQYMCTVDILKRFLKAERTGNWLLHLSVVREMLPYLAAAGHNSYTKSAYLYLQLMNQLEEKDVKVFNSFKAGHHVVRRSNRYWAGISSDLTIEQTLMRGAKTSGGLTRGRGVTELQRAKWVLSMPACAQINTAVQEVTGTRRLTSDQHVEMGSTRTAKDTEDMMVITTYLRDRNPFADDSTLRNIATGVVADVSVNVHKAKEAGDDILKTMEGHTAADLVLKKKNQVKTLGAKKSVKVDGCPVTVDPQLLFQRFITAANTTYEDKKDLFRYELCSFPSSLFESPDFLRQANKASLAEELWKHMPTSTYSSVPKDVQFVIDGGSLLQRLQWPWKRGSTFQHIISAYVQFVDCHYPSAVVVFDGYVSGPSTKDMTHLRRTKGQKGAAVHFSTDMALQSSKEQFLVNTENKQRFISALGAALERTCTVVHSKADADLDIVLTATECAKSKVTAVVGEDTDLLILLAHHASQDTQDIVFFSDKQKNTKIWSLKQLLAAFGDFRHLLLFLHAFTGCDTTSRPFGVGKAAALKKLKNSPQMQAVANVFLQGDSFEAIQSAGEKALVLMYGGNSGESLDTLRYRLFCSKVAVGTTFVQVHTLPPTSAAARFHSLRVYLQIQEWLGNSQTMEPTQCGWRLERDNLVPVTTDVPAAPSDLLKVIRCSCKSNCDSKRCSCRKHGLDCTSSCEECCGVSCSNSPPVLSMDTDETSG